MAKRKNKRATASRDAASSTALAENKARTAEAAPPVGDEDRPRKGHKPRETGPASPPGGGAPKRGLFDIYKPGQGQHTRTWSGVGFGLLVCWFAYFLWQKLEVVGTGSTTKIIQVSVAVGVIIVFGSLGYWLLGLSKRVNDFLIATEGEMKKVNWSNRKEIIGSTKVVIFVLISMAILLVVVDIFFMSFFNYIGVLKGEGFFEAIRGMF